MIVDLIEELEIQLDRELHTYSKLECTNESNYSSPNVSSSRNSLALTPVQIIDSSTPSVNPENSIVTSPNIQSPYRVCNFVNQQYSMNENSFVLLSC